MPELTAPEWDRYLDAFPGTHLLQTEAWGRLKASFGWEPAWVANERAGAQVLFRRLPLGFTIAYIPRGPVSRGLSGTDWGSLWPEVDALCRKRRAVFLKVEPDLWEDDDHPPMNDLLPGFAPSPHTIQPPRTVLVDLTGGEEAVLARMKQKTRYNVRLAEKKGVTVRPSADIDAFYALMQATGARDGFALHSLEYYRQAYACFHPRGEAELLVAEYEGEPLAALMVFARGPRAWYFYGASSDKERQRMPAYLLQWEAMRWAMSKGCAEYDLWGIPDATEAALEAGFETRSDGLWGVYRFKRGFGGRVARTVGAWDRVYLAPLYALYRLRAARSGGLGG